MPAGMLDFERTKTLSVDIFKLGKVEEIYRLRTIPESYKHSLTQFSLFLT